MIVNINNKTVKHDGYFAYDDCHKIYILEDDTDLMEAKESKYTIIPISRLKETFDNSCFLRFISNWKLNIQYSEQCEENTKFEFIMVQNI